MSLSLEVKKFINSEHIGDFVTVTLPSELPIRSDEIRAARRDKQAAERAAAEAKEKEAAEKQAETNVKDIERELAAAKEELARAKRNLVDTTKKREAMDPEFKEKQAAMDSARKDHSGKKSETDKLEEAFNAAEKERAELEKNTGETNTRLTDARSALEKAGTDGKAAAMDETQLTSKLKEANEAATEAETALKTAQEEAESAEKLREECEQAFTELNEAASSLGIEKRIFEKQLSEAEGAENRSARDHQRAKDELAVAEKQYEAARDGNKRNPEKDAMRLAQAKAKLEMAEAEERVRLANLEKEQLFVQSTKDKLSDCEHRIVENSDKLREASRRFEESKQKERTGSEGRLAAELKLNGKRAEVDSVKTKLEAAKARLAESKTNGENAAKIIADSEAELIRLKASLELATASAEEKKSAFTAAKTVSDAAERLFNQKKSEFDAVNAQCEGASKELEAARTSNASLNDRITALNIQLSEAKDLLDDAMRESEAAFNEAERLQDSIRSVKTKFETAKMHYLESGKGEPLILIHTAGQSLYTFRSVFYKLAMNYRVIALDLVGHGYSDRPDFFDYEIGDHAESIAGFMDAMGIESAHLLGFSMGAGFALEFAKRHPDRVGRVIAISPGGITGSMPLSVRMIRSGVFGGIASRVYRVRSVEKMLNECVFDHTVVGPHDINEYFRPASDPDGRAAIRYTIVGFDEDELAASLREVEAPVLIIWGDDDKWHPMEASSLYRSTIPNATVTIVRNAGHLVHEEKPDRICELVRSFVPAGYGFDD